MLKGKILNVANNGVTEFSCMNCRMKKMTKIPNHINGSVQILCGKCGRKNAFSINRRDQMRTIVDEKEATLIVNGKVFIVSVVDYSRTGVGLNVPERYKNFFIKGTRFQIQTTSVNPVCEQEFIVSNVNGSRVGAIFADREALTPMQRLIKSGNRK